MKNLLLSLVLLLICVPATAQSGFFVLTENDQDSVAVALQYSYFPDTGGQATLVATDTAGNTFAGDTALHQSQTGSDVLGVSGLSANKKYTLTVSMKPVNGSWETLGMSVQVQTLPNPQVVIDSFDQTGFSSVRVWYSYETYGDTLHTYLKQTPGSDSVSVDVYGTGTGNAMFSVTPDSTYEFTFVSAEPDTAWHYTAPSYPDPPSIGVVPAITDCQKTYLPVEITAGGSVPVQVEATLKWSSGEMWQLPLPDSAYVGDTVFLEIDSIVDMPASVDVTIIATSVAGITPLQLSAMIHPPESPYVLIDTTDAVSQVVASATVSIEVPCESTTLFWHAIDPGTGLPFGHDSMAVFPGDTQKTVYFHGLKSETTYTVLVGIATAHDTLTRLATVTTDPWPGPNVSIHLFTAGYDSVTFYGVADANSPLGMQVVLQDSAGGVWFNTSDTLSVPGPVDSFALTEYGLSPGTMYYRRVIGWNAEGYDTTHVVPFYTKDTVPPPPLVQTDQATDVSDDSMQLHGMVSSSFSWADSTTVWFRYHDGNSWQSTALQEIVLHNSLKTINVWLGGLPSETLVKYSIVAENEGGIVYGDTLATMTDSPPPCGDPSAKLFTAVNVASNSIVVPIEVTNPQGVVTVELRYASDPQSVFDTEVVYVGSGDTVIYPKLTDLNSCTTYWWYVVAYNDCGTFSTESVQPKFNATTDEPSVATFSGVDEWGPYPDGIDVQPYSDADTLMLEWGYGTNTNSVYGQAVLAKTGNSFPIFEIYFGDPGDYLFYRFRWDDGCGNSYIIGGEYFFYNTQSTGVEKREQGDISITPNPATDMVVVRGVSQVEKIVVHDIAGNVVIQTDDCQMNVSHLASGIYLVSIFIDGAVHTEKIIKQ